MPEITLSEADLDAIEKRYDETHSELDGVADFAYKPEWIVSHNDIPMMLAFIRSMAPQKPQEAQEAKMYNAARIMVVTEEDGRYGAYLLRSSTDTNGQKTFQVAHQASQTVALQMIAERIFTFIDATLQGLDQISGSARSLRDIMR